VSYDERCEELAEHFLPSGTSRRTIRKLAQRIQDAVEREIQLMIDEAGEPRKTN